MNKQSLLGLLDPEDEGFSTIRNVGNNLAVDTA
jgi:hypothetical protein